MKLITPVTEDFNSFQLPPRSIPFLNSHRPRNIPARLPPFALFRPNANFTTLGNLPTTSHLNEEQKNRNPCYSGDSLEGEISALRNSVVLCAELFTTRNTPQRTIERGEMHSEMGEKMLKRSDAIVLQYLKLSHAIHHANHSIRREEKRTTWTNVRKKGEEWMDTVPPALIQAAPPSRISSYTCTPFVKTPSATGNSIVKDTALMPPPNYKPPRKRHTFRVGSAEMNSPIKTQPEGTS
ncbi:hypothetical protein PROFUN_06284 [Planoprotostelium fungivorum]|uniref:Uncharacterized protein n=1 Tax=Planoprotostelium fungivorum TaxID=1890364 RepID=A0A2P6NEB6_9EUKA|nr:hypothetical protein PROFUN_06284 [Planoprotostelium fungivorum]